MAPINGEGYYGKQEYDYEESGLENDEDGGMRGEREAYLRKPGQEQAWRERLQRF